MVSLWPWKGEDNSPASFEKALSALAIKISKSQSQLDSLRQRGRRFKALWTLYASFAYLLCFVILFLVVGWQNWDAQEYTAVAGSPLFIYAIRKSITTYYNYRINAATERLEDQQGERAKTIEKLKAATRYNSTQELLEKYGEAPPPSKSKNQRLHPEARSVYRTRGQRTASGPPPTANIPRPGQHQFPIPSQPSTPQPLPNRNPPPQMISPHTPVSGPGQPSPPEFAPNAFSAPPQYAQNGEMGLGGHWYDRVLDLLMGEDETLPKNRMALICQNCRLVNGQAPPGTKTAADLGKWRCFGCGSMNGEEDEAVKVVQEMKERIEQDQSGPGTHKDEDDPVSEDGKGRKDDGSDEVEIDSSEETVEVKPKRGRPKAVGTRLD